MLQGTFYGSDEEIIAEAARILERRMQVSREPLNSPKAVQEYLKVKLGILECEVFQVMFLDAQHRLIASEEMFRGTLTQTSVYPREVVKKALHHNAAAVILSHNHPSGVCEPSRADELLTQALKAALGLVDIRILDHIVCAGTACHSMAEAGRL